MFVVLITGMVLGGVISHFVTVWRYGLNVGLAVRAYEENRLCYFGTNAFVAYLKEPPDAGIYALNYHLDMLDRYEVRVGTNGAVLQMRDINWMRAMAHVRLSNIYLKTDKPILASNQLETAWQALTQMGVRVGGITNRNDLVKVIHQEDEKGYWW